MTISTHKAEVVPVKMERHPNADSLSVVQVFGYTCCVRTEDWHGIDMAVYIVPDSVVDVRRPEFSFLADQAKADMTARVKAKRLRGVTSFGLLVPAPAGASLGDDLAEALGVTRYEPHEAGEQKDKFLIGGEEESGPDLDTGPIKYDVDSFERYADSAFQADEPVMVTEKLDGSNCRFVYWQDRFWVKSRSRWVKRVPDYAHVTVGHLTAQGMPEDKATAIVSGLASRPKKPNGFWEAMERLPALMDFLKANPGTTVYGEVYGSTNRLKYGLPDGNRFAAFDVFRDGRFLNASEARGALDAAGVPQVPLLNSSTPYNFSALKEMAEGKTLASEAKKGTIREGVVVKPIEERWHRSVGRVQLKIVNPDFLSM